MKVVDLRNLALGIGVSILSVVIFLGLAEWVVSKSKPHRSRSYFDEQTAKALGDPIPSKGQDESRIVVFGGSSAYGFPASDRYSITAWLRKSFKHVLPDQSIKVINCGWPGKASFHVLQGARAMLKYKPDLFIIYSGHNEFMVANRLFLDNRLHALSQEIYYTSAAYRYLTLRLNRLRKKLIYGKSGHAEKHYREETIANQVYRTIDVNLAEYERLVRAYVQNMEKVVRLARRHGVRVVFLTMPSNWRDEKPAKSVHRADLSPEEKIEWEVHYESGIKLLENRLYQPAVEAFKRAETIDKTFAELAFLMARAYEELSDYDAAKTYYVKARDLDVQPWRAKSSLNQAIRELAARHKLLLVDVEQAFSGMSPNGIIGHDLIHDNVHPSMGAQQKITEMILKVLYENNFPVDGGQWNWNALQAAKEGPAKAEWAVDGMDFAYRYILNGLQRWEQQDYLQVVNDLTAGLEHMPEYHESYVFLADAYWHLGNPEKSREMYGKIREINPDLLAELVNRYPALGESFGSYEK